jgi:hypothetical protein
MKPESIPKIHDQVYLENPNHISLYSQINSQRQSNTRFKTNHCYHQLLPEGSIINDINGITFIDKRFNLNLLIGLKLNKDNERLKNNPLDFNKFFIDNLSPRLKENNYKYNPCNVNKSFRIIQTEGNNTEPLFINQNINSGYTEIELTNRHYYDDEPHAKIFHPPQEGENLNDFRSFADYMDFILKNSHLVIQSLLERYKSKETIEIKVFDSNLSWTPKNNIFPSINA